VPRPTPFDLVFGTLADERFPRIRAGLEGEDRAADDRDAFLLDREVVTLLSDLRPEEGVGEAIDQLVALVHHAYLMWHAGRWTFRVSPARARSILAAGRHAEQPGAEPAAYYLQWPPRMLWAEVTPGAPHEPLDGWFAATVPGTHTLRVLSVFGLHADRMGFTVAEVVRDRADTLVRTEGTPIFPPVLPGGREAGLYSLTGTEELLEIAWRSHAVIAALPRAARTSSDTVELA